jgi:hypothetical protein
VNSRRAHLSIYPTWLIIDRHILGQACTPVRCPPLPSHQRAMELGLLGIQALRARGWLPPPTPSQGHSVSSAGRIPGARLYAVMSNGTVFASDGSRQMQGGRGYSHSSRLHRIMRRRAWPLIPGTRRTSGWVPLLAVCTGAQMWGRPGLMLAARDSRRTRGSTRSPSRLMMVGWCTSPRLKGSIARLTMGRRGAQHPAHGCPAPMEPSML